MADWAAVYGDYAITTDDGYFDDKSKLINQATDRSPLLGKFLKGAGADTVMQGGERLRMQTFFDEQNTAINYGGANPELAIKNPNIIVESVDDWRFTLDHMAWTDHEIGLQVNGGMTSEARHRTIHNIYKVKEQRCATSLIKKMEDELFATATATLMEGAAGSAPNSIAKYITEESDGLAPTWGGTTVQGLNPATETGWDNQRATFSAYNSATVGTQDLFAAFDQMQLLVRYQPLPKYEEFSERLNNPSFIACSSLGMRRYKDSLRESNDLLVAGGRQDPAYNSPHFSGIPLVYASTLDTAQLFDDGSSGVATEAAANVTGPRYWFMDTDVLFKVFHDERYFHKIKPQPSQNQPMAHVIWIDTWHNLICTERRKLGIVSPSTSLT